MRVARLAGIAASIAILLAALPAPGAPPGKAGGRAHPDTGGDQDCVTCHARATPAVAAAWEASRHGLALVKCLVCHGSTGRDFVRRPGPERCRGCHGVQVDSTAALARKGLDCFACHQPHSLAASPHARPGA